MNNENYIYYRFTRIDVVYMIVLILILTVIFYYIDISSACIVFFMGTIFCVLITLLPFYKIEVTIDSLKLKYFYKEDVCKDVRELIEVKVAGRDFILFFENGDYIKSTSSTWHIKEIKGIADFVNNNRMDNNLMHVKYTYMS